MAVRGELSELEELVEPDDLKRHGSEQGTLYLLHFSRPLSHARHYLGWTRRTARERVKDHRSGKGSPLVKAVLVAGIEIRLVRTWQGDRRLEREFKNRKNLGRLCPLCSGRLTRISNKQARQRRARKVSHGPQEAAQ